MNDNEPLKTTDDQKIQLMKLLPELGKNIIDLNKLVKDQYGEDTYQDLTIHQAAAIIRFLERKCQQKEQLMTMEQNEEVARI